jgi:hypothetical protein
MKYDNLMIDIETLGTTAEAAILSISAVCFNKNQVGPNIIYHISLPDALDTGKVSASTLQWWLKEDPELFKKTLSQGNWKLSDALINLSTFCIFNLNEKFKVWANPPNFDLKIIENKLDKIKDVGPIWNPFSERCVRTIKNIDLNLANQFINPEKHNPLEDCLVQIKQIEAINEKYNLNLI